MVVYEFTKDCGYETRTARIFVEDGVCAVFIEGAREIYEREAENLGTVIDLVKSFGFNYKDAQ